MLKEMNCNKYSYTSIAYNGIKFILKYSPSVQEMIFRVAMKASFETVFSPVLEFLTENGNPGVTSIIRDVLMFPEVLINANNRQEISKTGITYDGFSIAGTFSRGACKAGLIYNAKSVELLYNNTIAQLGYENSLGITEYALAGRMGGYVCDYGSLVANALSKEKQLKLTGFIYNSLPQLFEENSHVLETREEADSFVKYFKNSLYRHDPKAIAHKYEIPDKKLTPVFDQANKMESVGYLKYTMDNFKLWPTIKAVVPGTVVRSIIGDQMGEVIRWAKGLDIFLKPYYYFDGKKNQLISYVFNVTELNSDDNLWKQIEQVNQEIDGLNALALDSILLVSGSVYRMGREIVEANIMIPPVRAGYDLVVDYGMKEYPIQTAVVVSAAGVLYFGHDKILSYFSSDDIPKQECIGEFCLAGSTEL